MLRLPHRLFGPVEATATIAAPPDKVYATLEDPVTYPRWLVGADHIRGVDESFPAPGSEFAHTVGLGGPLTVDDHSEATAAEPGRRLALRVHAGWFHAEVEFRLRRVPGGTEVRFRERPVGVAAPLTPLLRPSLYARNRTSLVQLRDVVLAAAS